MWPLWPVSWTLWACLTLFTPVSYLLNKENKHNIYLRNQLHICQNFLMVKIKLEEVQWEIHTSIHTNKHKTDWLINMIRNESKSQSIFCKSKDRLVEIYSFKWMCYMPRIVSGIVNNQLYDMILCLHREHCLAQKIS